MIVTNIETICSLKVNLQEETVILSISNKNLEKIIKLNMKFIEPLKAKGYFNLSSQ